MSEPQSGKGSEGELARCERVIAGDSSREDNDSAMGLKAERSGTSYELLSAHLNAGIPEKRRKKRALDARPSLPRGENALGKFVQLFNLL